MDTAAVVRKMTLRGAPRPSRAVAMRGQASAERRPEAVRHTPVNAISTTPVTDVKAPRYWQFHVGLI
jgi:hypothetical protein